MSGHRTSAKPEFDDADEYTPITNFADIGKALSQIKTQLPILSERVGVLATTLSDDIKPKLDTVHEGFVELRTKVKGTDARVKALENRAERAHDCYQTGALARIESSQSEQRQACGRVTETLTEVTATQKTTKEAVDKLESRWGKVIVGAISVILFVLAAVAGWLVTLSTVQADVAHLTTQQGEMRESLDQFRNQNASANQQMVKQLNDVKRTVTEDGHEDDDDITIRDLCLKMAPDERRRFRQALGPGMEGQCP